MLLYLSLKIIITAIKLKKKERKALKLFFCFRIYGTVIQTKKFNTKKMNRTSMTERFERVFRIKTTNQIILNTSFEFKSLFTNTNPIVIDTIRKTLKITIEWYP